MPKKPQDTHEKSRIPRFKSIEEEAAFWDSHDSTEFEDEFVEVDAVRFVIAAPKEVGP